jgi:type VI secretion system protein ImpJ
MPPLLDISASTHLTTLLKLLIDVLAEKSESYTRTRMANLGKVGYASGEVADFWFLHAVNSGLASLRHIHTLKHVHPEELYLEMARLAGSLCTFSLKAEHHPRNIPEYSHMESDKSCFDRLDALIRELLNVVRPVNCIPIPLAYDKDYLYYGDVADTRCFGRCTWVFAIHSNIGVAELMKQTPDRVKICSAQFVKRLVDNALQGLTLTHMPVPPRAISGSPETQYFAVNKQGPCWDHIVATRKVGVYVPGEFFVEPEIELLVVLDA